MKNVIIIGAGPAGLTNAYYLLKNGNYNVTILEKEKTCGGISKTVKYHGNRMDLGGHRFFTKDSEVESLWKEILKVQGKPSYDDKKLKNNKDFVKGGPDPEKEDKVFLIRNRVSRIYYNKKFFDYPVNLSFKTIKNLGIKDTFISGFSYLKSLIIKKDESNLENFYINRFGKKLYHIFFEGYTEKLWGRSPKYIDSSWGSQRVKGISIKEVLKDFFCKTFKIKNKHKETSLIESYNYPKYGPGLMYEEMASKIIKMGGNIIYNANVTKINNVKNNIKSISYEKNNELIELECDYLVSSMPIKDLVNGMNNVKKDLKDIALGLPYRDFITVGLILNKLSVSNQTKIKTLNNIIPDCWIYVQSTDYKIGRIQVFNNWSPYLLDNKNNISLGIEYFCNYNDDFWNKSKKDLVNLSISELNKMGLIDSNTKLLDSHVEKVEKAYPAYFDTYKDFDKLRNYLDKFDNMFLIGRNGCHRYNNMDHSMKCGIVCANNIINNIKDKSNIWNINTEEGYHEEKDK